MSRPTHIVVDRHALQHNLQRVRMSAPNQLIAAAVKANGYGHGLLDVAQYVGADALAVACVEEALTLRAAGIRTPIWLLEGVFEATELPLCAAHDLWIAVHHVAHVEMLERTRLATPLHVWIKVDTGMHRLGIAPDSVPAIHARLQTCPNVREIGMMSHLARADERDSGATFEQTQAFAQATAGLSGTRSLANSAGILHWPQTHYDWVRPGIMLYGTSPFVGGTAVEEGLLPVMTFRTQLIALHRLRKDDAVGYGGTWVCPEDMDVAVAAVGYGDGYPRHAPSGTPVLLNGKEVPLIGRVSMDMITLDVRTQPQARVGDPVTLWGKGLPAERIAQAAQTITYTLFCGITARVRRKAGFQPSLE